MPPAAAITVGAEPAPSTELALYSPPTTALETTPAPETPAVEPAVPEAGGLTDSERLARLEAALGLRRPPTETIRMPDGYRAPDSRAGLRPYLGLKPSGSVDAYGSRVDTRDPGEVAADPYAEPLGPDPHYGTMRGAKGIRVTNPDYSPIERTEYKLDHPHEKPHLLLRPAYAVGRLAVNIIKLPVTVAKLVAVTAPRAVGDFVAGAVDWDPGPRGRGNRQLTPEDVQRINAKKDAARAAGTKAKVSLSAEATGHKVRHYGRVTAKFGGH